MFGEHSVKLPFYPRITSSIFIGIMRRSTMDFSLLIPPFLLNYFSINFLSTADYINFQKIMFSLGGLAIVNSIMEKVIFNADLFKGYLKSPRLYFIAAAGISYVGVFALALYLNIEPDYYWFLMLAPLFNISFALLLSEKRKNLSNSSCIKIAIKWIIASIFIMAIGFFCFYLKIININVLLVCMIILSLSQYFILFRQKNKF
jgi:hypothetical protein